MTTEELSALAQDWLAPLANELRGLIEKSVTMSPAAFFAEVERVVQSIPGLWENLDTPALASALEFEIGKGVIAGLSK